MIRAAWDKSLAFVGGALNKWWTDIRENYRPHVTTAVLTLLGYFALGLVGFFVFR